VKYWTYNNYKKIIKFKYGVQYNAILVLTYLVTIVIIIIDLYNVYCHIVVIIGEMY